DGGNSFWKHDLERAKYLGERKMHFIDVGVSGGVWGLDRGYCMMIGGPKEQVELLDPVFCTLAPGIGTVERTRRPQSAHEWKAEHGYVHCGPAGSGHFTKMIHNGIEYGMMQAYAEGFDILRARANDALDTSYDLNLSDIAEVWRRGSVISSWLLDLISIALAEDQSLSKFSGRVADSGEGRWTIDAAMEEAVPVDVLAASLFARYRSRVEESYADQMLSAMRFGFGGHVEMPQ
ncbi:MAG TPA: NADP-dependent phosphogluconate dehydrogenase, partial [Sphingomicrobium sp.]|nr:NADP-dependent phosphogluconate dehydrogenase [Sphingomicrobium sp.]